MSHIKSFWLSEIKTNKQNNQDCCGCGACENTCPAKAISMQYDEEGFKYPKVNADACIDCGLCKTVCPIENACAAEEGYLKTFAGYATNTEVLARGTSGGFVTSLSEEVIKDGGVVAGVKYDSRFIKAEYDIVEDVPSLKAFAGSKYVQSEKKDIFPKVRDILMTGRQVLFVGCPCDVYALKRFLKKDYDNLLTCELVCMGVTSYKVAQEYIETAERKNKAKIVYLNARSKKKGWFVPCLETEYENGKRELKPLFGTYYGYGFRVFSRPACFDCKFRGVNGVGDIRVGDFWGIKESDPFWNKNGVSCIFVRTKKGLNFIDKLKNADFYLYETNYEYATVNNMSSYKNKDKSCFEQREKFAEIFLTKGLVGACKKTQSFSDKVKSVLPTGLQIKLKKVYHKLHDKKV